MRKQRTEDTQAAFRCTAIEELALIIGKPLSTVKYKMRAAPKFTHILEAYGPAYLVLLTTHKTWGDMSIENIDAFFARFAKSNSYFNLHGQVARSVLDITKRF